MPQQQPLSFGQVHRSLVGLFDGDMHAKRIESLANVTLGGVRTGSLAVSTIGHGLALARRLTTKHAIKQVDRLLSNEGIDIDAALRHWVPYVVGPRGSPHQHQRDASSAAGVVLRVLLFFWAAGSGAVGGLGLLGFLRNFSLWLVIVIVSSSVLTLAYSVPQRHQRDGRPRERPEVRETNEP